MGIAIFSFSAAIHGISIFLAARSSGSSMILPRQMIGLLALALASLGPIPLWLHHQAVHSHDHAASTCVESACAGHSSTDEHSHSHDGSQTETEDSDQHGQVSGFHDHDCAICFQLSQSSSPACTAGIGNGSDLVTPNATSFEHFYLIADENPHRPRGPPSCRI